MKLKQRLDEETSFMLLEPDERDTSTQTLARHLEEVSRSENSVMIVADQHGDLAGYVELVGGKFGRNRSTTHVIIGVLAEASGKGVGTGLLEEAKRWAAARGLHRIELNVMARNHRAIALYERVGFVREGRRVDCLLIDGKFLDEPVYGHDPARLVIAVTVMTALKQLGVRGSRRYSDQRVARGDIRLTSKPEQAERRTKSVAVDDDFVTR